MAQPESTSAHRPPAWLAPVFLAGLVWFSHFFWSSKFGFYEDDYVLLEPPMNCWQLKHVASATVGVWENYLQGRPLHYSFAYWLTYATTKPGGSLGVAYVAAFAIQVLNAWLVLLVARRAIGPRLAPLAAALFALAPAHTTHQFLHVCFCVQPSVTFMLLSLLAYQRGWRLLSYLPAALTLLTYETCFLPLFLAPLLTIEAPRACRVIAHGVILTAILVAAFAVRSHLGESRVSAELSDRTVAVSKALRLATTGPAASARAFIAKPELAFERVADPNYFTGDGLRPLAAAWAILAATAFVTVLLATGTSSQEHAPRWQLLRVALAGAAMVVISYPAALNRDPTVLEGRMSSVHLTASTGWALVAGALMGLALSVLPRTGRRALWGLLVAYLGVLAAYQVTVQRDYARAWAEQRRFWGEVNRLCPDLDDETVILLPYPPRKCAAVEVNSHADWQLPQRMFFKAEYWPHPPQLLHVEERNIPHDFAGYAWSAVQLDGAELVYQAGTDRRVPLRQGKVIALYPNGDGRYHRLTGSLDVRGTQLRLREPSGPTPDVIWLPLRLQLTPP